MAKESPVAGEKFLRLARTEPSKTHSMPREPMLKTDVSCVSSTTEFSRQFRFTECALTERDPAMEAAMEREDVP